MKAFIVKKDLNVTSDDIIEFCATQLSNYKVPKQIEFRNLAAENNVGKTLRRKLRDEISQSKVRR
jgi:long-chain acyl-CoA synthetase